MPGLRRAWRDSEADGDVQSRAPWLAYVVVFMLATVTYQQNFVWTNEIALWDQAVRRAPTKPRPLINLARVLEAKHFDDAAVSLSLRAIEAARDRRRSPYQRAYSRAAALTNLGHLYAKHGETKRAMDVLDMALAEQPKFVAALFNKSAVLARLGRCGESGRSWDRAYANATDAIPPRPMCEGVQ